MNISDLAAMTTAMLLLTACSDSTDAVAEKKEPPVAKEAVLPPSIKESHSYRCKEAIVKLDFLSDDMSANLRIEPNISAQLKAPAPGEAFVNGDYHYFGRSLIVSSRRR